MAGTMLVHSATVVDRDTGAFVGMTGSDGKEYPINQSALQALVSGAALSVSPSGDTAGAADSAAIQAAINAVALLATAGTVTLTAGRFYTNTAWLMKSGVTVQGKGKTATLVKLAPVARSTNGTIYNMVYVGTEGGESSVNNWAILDMTLDFDRDNQPGLAANLAAASDAVGNCVRTYGNVTNGEVRRCRLINGVSHGLIGVQGLYGFSATHNECYGNTYRGIHLHGNSGAGAYDTADGQGRLTVQYNTIHDNGKIIIGAVSPDVTLLTSGLFAAFANQELVDISFNDVYREAGCGIQLTGDTPGAPTTDTRMVKVFGNTVRHCGFGIYINNGIKEVSVIGNLVELCGVAIAGHSYSSNAYGAGIFVTGAQTNDDMPVNVMLIGNTVARCAGAGLASYVWGKGSSTNARAGVVSGNTFVANLGGALGGSTPLGSQVDLQHTSRLAFQSNTYDGATPGTVAWNATSLCDSIQILGCVGIRSAGNTAINCDAPNSNLQPGSELLGHVAQSGLPDSTYFFSATPQQYLQTFTVPDNTTAWFKNTQLGSTAFVKGIRKVLLSSAGVITGNTVQPAAGQNGQSVTVVNTGTNSITLSAGSGLLNAIVLASQGSAYTMTYSATIGKWA